MFLVQIYTRSFGGKPKPGGPVQHCFPVNGNEQDPEVSVSNCNILKLLRAIVETLAFTKDISAYAARLLQTLHCNSSTVCVYV